MTIWFGKCFKDSSTWVLRSLVDRQFKSQTLQAILQLEDTMTLLRILQTSWLVSGQCEGRVWLMIGHAKNDAVSITSWIWCVCLVSTFGSFWGLRFHDSKKFRCRFKVRCVSCVFHVFRFALSFNIGLPWFGIAGPARVDTSVANKTDPKPCHILPRKLARFAPAILLWKT